VKKEYATRGKETTPFSEFDNLPEVSKRNEDSQTMMDDPRQWGAQKG